MANGPRFSFNLYGTPTADLVPLARTGEECGFEAIWLGDHVLAPRDLESEYPYATAPGANPLDGAVLNDVWVAVGAMLAATSTLHVGTGIYILPQRNPFLTALSAATAQNLSGGRLLLGVGAGWLREEFALLDQDFDDRGSRMDEIVEVLRELWQGGFRSHSGTTFHFANVRSEAPIRPVPILIGGSTAPAIRRAARLGDGWYSTANLSLEETVAVRQRIDRHRDELGRAGAPFEYYVRLLPPITVATATQFVEAGFTHLTLGTNTLWRQAGATTLRQRLDLLERLRDEVVAPLAATPA